MSDYRSGLQQAMLAAPSPFDCPGYIYTFWDRGLRLSKFGQTGKPPRRAIQWGRQCDIQRKDWHATVWRVPFA
ncbi:hypothetical protein B0H17DRAFT_1030415, partial [Mycena rosella]